MALRRRCTKPGAEGDRCREWHPCPTHWSWGTKHTRDLPSNWGQLKTAMAPLKLAGCATCGRKDMKLELDHIIPRFVPWSTDELNNLQWLDPVCHKAKLRSDRKTWSQYWGKKRGSA
jgi:hypothetical protein